MNPTDNTQTPNPTTPEPQPTPQPSSPATPQTSRVLAKARWHDYRRHMVHSFRGFLSFVTFVGTVAVASLLINQFIFQTYYVDGTSMHPTLQNNDRLIVNKIPKTIAALQGKTYTPNRGDVITFISDIPDANNQPEQLIKRVIGLPGDSIAISNGIVTVTNTQHPHGFDVDKALGLHLASTYEQEPFQTTVPKGKVFVMGDNRTPNGSYDSRLFGPVALDKVQGVLSLRVYPFNTWKTFSTPSIKY